MFLFFLSRTFCKYSSKLSWSWAARNKIILVSIAVGLNQEVIRYRTIPSILSYHTILPSLVNHPILYHCKLSPTYHTIPLTPQDTIPYHFNPSPDYHSHTVKFHPPNHLTYHPTSCCIPSSAFLPTGCRRV